MSFNGKWFTLGELLTPRVWRELRKHVQTLPRVPSQFELRGVSFVGNVDFNYMACWKPGSGAGRVGARQMALIQRVCANLEELLRFRLRNPGGAPVEAGVVSDLDPSQFVAASEVLVFWCSPGGTDGWLDLRHAALGGHALRVSFSSEPSLFAGSAHLVPAPEPPARAPYR